MWCLYTMCSFQKGKKQFVIWFLQKLDPLLQDYFARSVMLLWSASKFTPLEGPSWEEDVPQIALRQKSFETALQAFTPHVSVKSWPLSWCLLCKTYKAKLSYFSSDWFSISGGYPAGLLFWVHQLESMSSSLAWLAWKWSHVTLSCLAGMGSWCSMSYCVGLWLCIWAVSPYSRSSGGVHGTHGPASCNACSSQRTVEIVWNITDIFGSLCWQNARWNIDRICLSGIFIRQSMLPRSLIWKYIPSHAPRMSHNYGCVTTACSLMPHNSKYEYE